MTNPMLKSEIEDGPQLWAPEAWRCFSTPTLALGQQAECCYGIRTLHDEGCDWYTLGSSDDPKPVAAVVRVWLSPKATAEDRERILCKADNEARKAWEAAQ